MKNKCKKLSREEQTYLMIDKYIRNEIIKEALYCFVNSKTPFVYNTIHYIPVGFDFKKDELMNINLHIKKDFVYLDYTLSGEEHRGGRLSIDEFIKPIRRISNLNDILGEVNKIIYDWY